MSTLEAIESIQATLEPLGALQGEHTQLETWVHHSFESLERLHEELVEWQSELARKQTELDLREDSLDKILTNEHNIDAQVVQCNRDLELARGEIKQLTDQKNELLQKLEGIESTTAQLTSDLKSERERSEQFAVSLETERQHASREQEKWTEEIQYLRDLLNKQYELFSDQMEMDHKKPKCESADQ